MQPGYDVLVADFSIQRNIPPDERIVSSFIDVLYHRFLSQNFVSVHFWLYEQTTNSSQSFAFVFVSFFVNQFMMSSNLLLLPHTWFELDQWYIILVVLLMKCHSSTNKHTYIIHTFIYTKWQSFRCSFCYEKLGQIDKYNRNAL